MTTLYAQPSKPDTEDALSLLNGDLSAIRVHVQALFTHLANHQEIDRDVWDDLGEFAKDAMEGLERLLCVRCLKSGRVELGRGNGFDHKKCDACLRLEREL